MVLEGEIQLVASSHLGANGYTNANEMTVRGHINTSLQGGYPLHGQAWSVLHVIHDVEKWVKKNNYLFCPCGK
jgi:hypothetical protein